jgi:hypothetical protein
MRGAVREHVQGALPQRVGQRGMGDDEDALFMAWRDWLDYQAPGPQKPRIGQHAGTQEHANGRAERVGLGQARGREAVDQQADAPLHHEHAGKITRL